MSKDSEQDKYLFDDPDNIFMDLFFNRFDTTWMGNTEQRQFTFIEPELKTNATDDGTVIYNYNKEKFRSDDFTSTHNGLHILFAGCSETEGVGGNIEDTWSHILYNRIYENKKCSGFFNLARSGWGWSRIISNSLVYFEKYGYPDVFFIMLPNHSRKFLYDFDTEYKDFNPKWVYWQQYPFHYRQKDDHLKSRLDNLFISPKEYFENFTYFLICWKLFVSFCKTNNIKMIFSTWDQMDKKNMDNMSAKYQSEIFNNYISVDYNKSLYKYSKLYYEKNEVKKDDHTKRDGHAGRIVHHYWAEEFYKKYKDIDHENI